MEPTTILDLISKYLPIVLSMAVALGLAKLVGGALRKLWEKVKGDAKKTPTLIDDALVNLVNKQVMAIIEKIESGKVDEAKVLLAAVQAVLPKPVKK